MSDAALDGLPLASEAEAAKRRSRRLDTTALGDVAMAPQSLVAFDQALGGTSACSDPAQNRQRRVREWHALLRFARMRPPATPAPALDLASLDGGHATAHLPGGGGMPSCRQMPRAVGSLISR